ncbi:MAG TPA: hypothetical protein VJR89_09495 [Polyangiales bacterium]|nr:hypothetical protein [Polyangiales bacterium]
MLEPPLPLAPLSVQQVWHKRAQHDSALERLRGLGRQSAKAL